jgi:hypothetical protein
MKGKKFDAAEKHFKKKEEQYLKKIKAMEELIAAKDAKDKEKDSIIADLKEQNAVLLVQNKKFFDICHMSEEDLKILIEKDRNVAKAASCMLHLMHLNGTY